jgi:hypothetical protein
MMLMLLAIVIHFHHQLALSLSNNPALHFQLQRRGFRFPCHEPANLTKLHKLLSEQEKRYMRTHRKANGNRLVREWRPEHEDDMMLDEVGAVGSW